MLNSKYVCSIFLHFGPIVHSSSLDKMQTYTWSYFFSFLLLWECLVSIGSNWTGWFLAKLCLYIFYPISLWFQNPWKGREGESLVNDKENCSPLELASQHKTPINEVLWWAIFLKQNLIFGLVWSSWVFSKFNSKIILSSYLGPREGLEEYSKTILS